MLVLKVVFVLLLLPEKETFLEPFVLRDLLPSSIGSYYRYIGSLTTPPCSKVVEWIVFSRPVFLSYKQVSLCHTYEGVSKLLMLFVSLKKKHMLNYTKQDWEVIMRLYSKQSSKSQFPQYGAADPVEKSEELKLFEIY